MALASGSCCVDLCFVTSTHLDAPHDTFELKIYRFFIVARRFYIDISYHVTVESFARVGCGAVRATPSNSNLQMAYAYAR